MQHLDGPLAVHTLEGDFNVGLNSTININQPTSLSEWTSSLRLSHPINPAWETIPSYLGGQGTSRIDHAFYTANTCTFVNATETATQWTLKNVTTIVEMMIRDLFRSSYIIKSAIRLENQLIADLMM